MRFRISDSEIRLVQTVNNKVIEMAMDATLYADIADFKVRTRSIIYVLHIETSSSSMAW